MRIKPTKFLGILFVLAMSILAVRFIYIASSMETGWERTATHWLYAPWEWVGWGGEPLGEKEPAEQAEFWLRETKRVVDQHPESASIHMGAAWMLDSPNPAFVGKYFKVSDQSLSPLGNRLELQIELIKNANSKFRALCMKDCLTLAKRATELEPNEQKWWRMRALLLFEGDIWEDFAPRSEDWLEVLDACRNHDSENALYDYLAAWALWNQAGEYEYDFSTESDNALIFIRIKDAECFAKAKARFERAQKRKFLAVGESGITSVPEFLSHCGISKDAQKSAVECRLLSARQSAMFSRIWGWQTSRANLENDKISPTQKLHLYLQLLHFFDQAIIPKETTALNTLISYTRYCQWHFNEVEKLINDDSITRPEGELQRLKAKQEEVSNDAVALRTALTKLAATVYPNKDNAYLPQILAAVASTTAVWLLLGGAFALLLSRWLHRKDDIPGVRLGWWRCTIVWLLGYGLTFVLFGMAPGEMISHKHQAMSVNIAIRSSMVAVIIAIIWAAVAFAKRRNFRYSMKTLFLIMTAFAILAACTPAIARFLVDLSSISFEVWMPAKELNNIDADALRNAMKLGKGSWYWSFLQWFAYGGIYIGLLVSLFLSGCWFLWLSARRAKESIFSYWLHEKRKRLGNLGRSIVRSAIFAALIWSLVYLSAATQALKQHEALYQHSMQYNRNPFAHWKEIDDVQKAIKSSWTEQK